MEKPIIIKGPCRDLEDILNIARVTGRKVLGVPFVPTYIGVPEGQKIVIDTLGA